METINDFSTICGTGVLFAFFIMLLIANIATLARRAMSGEE